jgi:hypothetical protein
MGLVLEEFFFKNYFKKIEINTNQLSGSILEDKNGRSWHLKSKTPLWSIKGRDWHQGQKRPIPLTKRISKGYDKPK